jgi:hypothetical protein
VVAQGVSQRLQVAVSRWLADTGGARRTGDLRYPFQLNAYVERWVRVGAELRAADPVHDGDTIYVTVDWGKGRCDLNQPIRLLGCAARELDDPGGTQARDNLALLLPAGSWVGLATVRDDKFAPRWDCQVAYLADGHLMDLATVLCLDYWAVPWNGRGAQPKPPWPRPGVA